MSAPNNPDSQPERQVKAPQEGEDRERQEKAAREQMLRVIFTSEARERLSNIRMIKPELAAAVENQVIQLAASGRLRSQVSDEQLKEMLGSLQRPKREFKINWK